MRQRTGGWAPVITTIGLALLGAVLASATATAQDVVLTGGRVMDPETGLDAVRHVVIENGRITAITSEAPPAGTAIDVSGLVVAPGFIDMHAHGQDMISNRYQAADGVTTAMDLEIGYWPVAGYYAARAGDALINYGATVSHVAARYAVLDDVPSGDFDGIQTQAFGSESQRREATDAEIKRMLVLLERGLREGALGVGFGITYTPGASHEEIFRAFRLAAELGAPVFVHVRASSRMGGDKLAPMQEVIANAAATGVALHIVHLNSSTDESAKPVLEVIRAARANGVDVTTESYPYTAGSTLIESALFDDWKGDYGDLQWTATGERLTEETYTRYRKEGGMVIIHGRREETP